MDVYFQSEIGSCAEFEPKQKAPVSIVISPLRVEGTENRLKVISGCNMWRGCQNAKCYFSAAGRSLDKIRARKVNEPGVML